MTAHGEHARVLPLTAPAPSFDALGVQLARAVARRAHVGPFAVQPLLAREKADPKKADDSFKQDWPQTNPHDFYNRVNPLLDAVANGDPQAYKWIRALLMGMEKSKHNRAYILDKIRVDATLSEGAKHGSGLDELFQTASTDEWIVRSLGDVEGKRPHSLFLGKPFNWVGAQKFVRVKTESLVWFANNRLSGHSGAVWTDKGGWYGSGQKRFHDLRDEAVRQASSPRNAVVRAILSTLRETANAARWDAPTNIFRGKDTADMDFKDVAQRAQAWFVLARYRDQLKMVYEDFVRCSDEDWGLDQLPRNRDVPYTFSFQHPQSGPLLYAPSSPIYSYGYGPPSPLIHQQAPLQPPTSIDEWAKRMQTSQSHLY